MEVHLLKLFQAELGCGRRIRAAIEGADLKVPETGAARGGDRSGQMSEYRGYILAEMQSLARRHPGASW